MISGQELVQLAMTQIGSDRPADLARRIGLTAYGSPRRVTRWLSGENEPDYESTMKLLELVGALRMEVLDPEAARAEVAAELARASRARDLEDRAAGRPRARPRRETG